ncbi:MAG TPA: hypothetical protein VFM05_07275 [Candidatus Saccharimonadales bacterium]|nr:hypothetical protein [Candidatus Saccharimonadales bacterium]
MNSVANQLRHPFRLFIAMILLLALPLIGIGPRAAALDAHDQHAMHGQQIDLSLDCAAACARATTVPPMQATINNNEVRTPDPEPQEYVPYHLQFQFSYTPKVHRPNPLYSSSPARPPDIVKMSAHLRF